MTLYYLIKRNTLLYFKDRSAVFFSLLSVLIVLMLMIVFLGDMNQDSLLNALATLKAAPNTDSDINNVDYVILMWTIAGILAVNSFTVPLTTLGIHVQDKQYHKLESFFCAPVSRIKLLTGYLVSAVISGMVMCLATLLIAFLYVTMQGFSFLGIKECMKVIGLLFVSVTTNSCLILLLSQFIRTAGAWSSLSTIAGTLIGFLGGIYLPMSMLPQTIQKVLKSLPFLHETGMLRSVFTETAVSETFKDLPGSAITSYNEMMGIQIEMFDQNITAAYQVPVLLACGIIALSIAVYVLKKHTSFDR